MSIPVVDPQVAPTGVIQNPGVGEILGQGFSNLAQFLAQQHQQQQQQQNEAAQRALQQQQLNQTGAYQQFQMDQARAQAAAQQQQQQQSQADQSSFGKILQGLSAPPSDTSLSVLGAIPGMASTVSVPVTPTFASATGGMDPAVVARFIASPVYKAWSDAQKGVIAKPGEQLVNPMTGAPIGTGVAALPPTNPDKAQVVLTRMGLPITTTGPDLARMGRLAEYNTLMTKTNAETTPQPANLKGESAFGQKFGELTAQNLVSETPKLKAAAQNLRQLDQMRGVLQSGINSGTFGGLQQAFGQAAVGLGWASNAQMATVENTQVYGKLVAQQMAETAKDFATRGLTAADIKFVQDANGANFKWTTPSLLKAVDIQSKMIRQNGADHNEVLNKIPASLADSALLTANRVDLSGGMPRTKTFQAPDGTTVLGTLDDRTGHYLGTVNGQIGYLDGYHP